MIVVTKVSGKVMALRKKTIMMSNNETDRSHQTTMRILQHARYSTNPGLESLGKAPMQEQTSDKLILQETRLLDHKKEPHTGHHSKAGHLQELMSGKLLQE